MKYIITILILTTFSCISFAEKLAVPGTSVTFESPDGFFALSKEIIEFKWPNNNGPAWVVGNETGATTIAYDLKDNDISGANLKDLLTSFKGVFERVIPGIKWKKRKVIKFSGKKWAYLEMTSNAVDTDIYNIMLVTSYGNKMLTFNFNSTKEEFPKYEKILRKSIKSIEFKSDS